MVEASGSRGRAQVGGPCRRARLALLASSVVLAALGGCSSDAPALGDAEPGRPGAGPETSPSGTVPTDVLVRTSTGDGLRRLLLLSSSDGGTLRLTTSGSGSTVAASSKDGDARAVWFDPEGPASVDHSACVTWTSLGGNTQGGLALRVRNDHGRTRAITVTNNVYLQGRWIFNVHLWDTADRDPGGDTRVNAIRQFELRDAGLVRDLPPPPPGRPPVAPEVILPWRICARIEGYVLTFKVWPASMDEPGWDDPRHGGTTLVPEAWVYPGRPGWYAGHIGPRTPLVQTDEGAGP